MAIWNCSDDHGLAALLALALPQVDTEAEMIKSDAKELEKVATYADSMTDCLLAQQAALADLIANADIPNLSKHTMQDIGWLLREVTHLHELVRRVSDLAHAYSGAHRALHQAMIAGNRAEIARLTQ